MGINTKFMEIHFRESADRVITQNLFQNWVRAIGREFGNNVNRTVSLKMNHIRLNLDESFKENLSYDELAVIAGMSKSDICHRLRKAFETNFRK
jgi:AraC-like DNA-binding protein